MSHLEKWQPLSSRHVYTNKWISVREDMVGLPNARSTIYGVITLGDCVGILPVTEPIHPIRKRIKGTATDMPAA